MADLVRQGANSERFRDYIYRTLGPVPEPQTIDRWVRGHFRYRPEVNEVVRTPDFMLSDLQAKGYVEGDCDCITVFYATVLRVYGRRVRLVAIRYSEPVEFQHVFGEYLSGASWRMFDPTVDPSTVHEELERMVEPV